MEELYYPCFKDKTGQTAGFLTRCDTVLPQKMVRGMTFQMKEVEGLYYLCSENKGADQLPRLLAPPTGFIT